MYYRNSRSNTMNVNNNNDNNDNNNNRDNHIMMASFRYIRDNESIKAE